MDEWVNFNSKLKQLCLRVFNKQIKLLELDPKPSDLTRTKLKGYENLKGWTCVCCKILGKVLVRGERPIKLGDSWFFAKSIKVERLFMFIIQVELFPCDGALGLLNTEKLIMGFYK